MHTESITSIILNLNAKLDPINMRRFDLILGRGLID